MSIRMTVFELYGIMQERAVYTKKYGQINEEKIFEIIFRDASR